MPEYIDQVGRKVLLKKAPLRIVSTVPSQTELLYDLGLSHNVVGITAYCVHPKNWLKEKTVIGGTKDLQIDKIRSLKPDLILGNKEENIKEQIEALAEDIPVWLSDIVTVEDATNMIAAVGNICDKQNEAEAINDEINRLRQKLKAKNTSPKTAAYFIWKDPYMLTGDATFINSMMQEAGLKNVVRNHKDRYPALTLEELTELQPEVVLLSSEPYSFNTGDLNEIAPYFPNSKLRIVDGELFSWYGSRMIKALKYFNNAF